jgi:hypothetical protein
MKLMMSTDFTMGYQESTMAHVEYLQNYFMRIGTIILLTKFIFVLL